MAVLRFVNRASSSAAVTVPVASTKELIDDTATNLKSAPAKFMRDHCWKQGVHMPKIPAEQPDGFANMQIYTDPVTGERYHTYGTAGVGAPPEKKWEAADGPLNFRRDLKIAGPFTIGWTSLIQLDPSSAPTGLNESGAGICWIHGNGVDDQVVRVQFFEANQVAKGGWLSSPKLQAGETDWAKWDGVTWTGWKRESQQAFTTEVRNVTTCHEAARLLYLMPVNGGRVELKLSAWQDGTTLSDIPEARINPVLPNHWGNIDVTLPAGWTIDGVPARGVEELKIWKVPGQNAFTTSFTQHAGLVIFDLWPTDAELRLAMERGGFRAFMYVGAEAGKVVGIYTNPNVGRAVGVAITPPVKI
jgi:hypothetical protein